VAQDFESMELIGGLSNPATRDKLARLNAHRKSLLRDSGALGKPTPSPPARAGELARSIYAVLADSQEAMSVSEIRAAVERQLQQPVNPGSLKAYLSEATLAANPKFRRIARGSYRLV
jgi:hypothetical protein